jgi:O-antigen/teichoic acid export membrane protein
MKLLKNKYLKCLITFLLSLAGNDKALVLRIFRGASWIIFGAVLSKFLLLIGSICVARILGQSVYGELGILRSTMSSFAMLASMGLGITATKFIGENLQRDKFNIGGIIAFTIRMAVILSLIISILLIIFSEKILLMIEAPHLKSELIISSIILFFIAMNGALI